MVKHIFQISNLKIDSLGRFDKLKLLDGLEIKRFFKNDYIVEEGEDGDYFYIVEEGLVECVKNESDDPDCEKAHVRDLGRGEHFGELALINDVKRTLSVRVKTDTCKVLALGRVNFNKILGNIGKYLKKNYDDEFDRQFRENKEREELKRKE